MAIQQTLLKQLQRPWFLALLLFAIYIGVTGYKYGWDDQHLEIPLLKNLIDPTLYADDYYIESLKQNFSSYFYPILAKLITVEQIPITYLFLFIISRYFLFYWIYKIWLLIADNDRFKAFCCVMVFILMTRVHEFLYKTFSHQEFALAFIFAGIFYFFKERFILSAFILGAAANIHALYSLFPMLFMLSYLAWQIKKHGFKTFFLSGCTFAAAATPFLFWIIQNRLGPTAVNLDTKAVDWMELFILACPQNFFFAEFPRIPREHLFSDFNLFYYLTQSYLVLIALFLLNVFFNKDFQKNKKALAFCLSAFGLLILCLIFTYIHPHRFFIDLNLSRNKQFLLFLLMGYTTLLTIQKIEKGSLVTGLIFTVLFTLLKYNNQIITCAVLIMIFVLMIEKISSNIKNAEFPLWLKILKSLGVTICLVLIGWSYYGIWEAFQFTEFKFIIRLNFLIICILLLAAYFLLHLKPLQQSSNFLKWKRGMILIPLSIFLLQYSYFHFRKYQEEHTSFGFWQMQRSWEDMQRYVKLNTPKDTMIMVPYNMEMGGFRILSERKIICSYRDCGIIGFDYQAAVEWYKRVQDIEAFKVALTASTSTAIRNAIVKYHADYIVFMRYAAPTRDNELLQKVYTNESFVLFRVLPHPGLEKP